MGSPILESEKNVGGPLDPNRSGTNPNLANNRAQTAPVSAPAPAPAPAPARANAPIRYDKKFLMSKILFILTENMTFPKGNSSVTK